MLDLGLVPVGEGESLLKVLNRLVHHNHHKKDLEKGTQDSLDQNVKKHIACINVSTPANMKSDGDKKKHFDYLGHSPTPSGRTEKQ